MADPDSINIVQRYLGRILTGIGLLVWDYAFTQMQAVVAGTRTEPTVDELIAELPARI